LQLRLITASSFSKLFPATLLAVCGMGVVLASSGWARSVGGTSAKASAAGVVTTTETAAATGTTGAITTAPSELPAMTGGATPTGRKVRRAPITAKHANVTYAGPIYELLPTGQTVPYQPPATPSALDAATGGAVVSAAAGPKPKLLVPGHTARLIDGLAAAPIEAPPAVQKIIWAGDELIGLPYIYGGGHGSWKSPGYDCSGSVSYALHGDDLLPAPEDSSEFEGFGGKGQGEWITIFANGGHAYMTVAGLRLDTSPVDDPTNEQGPRWRPLRPENAGFTIRHPRGL
jgi:cell wall-associated NlpC family hydrolase